MEFDSANYSGNVEIIEQITKVAKTDFGFRVLKQQKYYKHLQGNR